jgi:hypothetical protein
MCISLAARGLQDSSSPRRLQDVNPSTLHMISSGFSEKLRHFLDCGRFISAAFLNISGRQ